MTDDLLISKRIKWWRAERQLAQSVAADRAGITQSYWSKLESGARRIESRATLDRICQALGVSYADLTGQPARPDTPELAAAHAAVERLRLAHVALDHDAPVTPTAPLDELDDLTEQAARAWQECTYDKAGQHLGYVLTQLGGHLPGPHRARALTLYVQALDTAVWTVRVLGHYDLAYALASRQAEAASQSEDPELIGLAAFTRALTISAASSGDPAARATGVQVAQRAIDALSPHATGTVLQVLGMLHLAACRAEVTDIDTRLSEARALAARTGEGNAARLYFGPTNVGIWSVHFAAERGEGGRVRELARDVNLEAIPSTARRAMFWRHMGLGLAQEPREQDAAVTAFLRSERVAPGKLRLDPIARETVGHMLSRARAAAGGKDLRRLARHAGVPESV